MEQERVQLQQQAESLSRRLEQVLSDKSVPAAAFDADTPIDKTLAFLQEIIKVNMLGTCAGRENILQLLAAHLPQN